MLYRNKNYKSSVILYMHMLGIIFIVLSYWSKMEYFPYTQVCLPYRTFYFIFASVITFKQSICSSEFHEATVKLYWGFKSTVDTP